VVKRGYSRDFTPRTETYGRYLLDKVPATLWSDVRAKCKRQGGSVRGLILSLLKEWVDGPDRSQFDKLCACGHRLGDHTVDGCVCAVCARLCKGRK
jgi:hypothetical protein